MFFTLVAEKRRARSAPKIAIAIDALRLKVRTAARNPHGGDKHTGTPGDQVERHDGGRKNEHRDAPSPSDDQRDSCQDDRRRRVFTVRGCQFRARGRDEQQRQTRVGGDDARIQEPEALVQTAPGSRTQLRRSR